MAIFWSVIGFVLVIGLLVTIHEWAHYQVARWFNIKVTEFSIGFGKPLYEKCGSETCFKIAMIPLGGYVKFVDEREAEVCEADLPRAFNRQSVYKRFAVVAAGPIMNLLFAWIVFTAMYMIGISGFKPIINEVEQATPVAVAVELTGIDMFRNHQAWSIVEVEGVSISSWQMLSQEILKSLVKDQASISVTLESLDSKQTVVLPNIALATLDVNNGQQNWVQSLGFRALKVPLPAVLGRIVKDSPAEKVGLQTGDIILSLNEQSISQWDDFEQLVRAHPGENVQLQYQRSESVYSVSVPLDSFVLENDEVIGRMGVGVKVDHEIMAPYASVIRYNLVDAFYHGFVRSIDLVEMSLVMLKRMILGEVGVQNLSGPLSIAQFSGQALQTGLISFLSLLGLLSLSLGILNLLPIPVLDGGHLVYYLIEMVKGSPVSEQVMMVGQKIGLVLILVMTFVALFNDVVRISNG